MTIKQASERFIILLLVVILLALGVGLVTKQYGTGFHEKTLWDWLELLIVPAVLVIGAYLFSRAERESERRIEADRFCEDSLQRYLDHMTELILEKGLLASDSETEVRDVARARTLTVLRVLDGLRKGIVLRFLYEAGLIMRNNVIVKLSGADLSEANLQKIHLENSDLTAVNLSGANLRGSFLSGAVLRANLTKVDLRDAFLHKADLVASDLNGANLKNAGMIKVNLYRAKVSDKQLARASHLRLARMMDGSQYDGRFKLRGDIALADENEYFNIDDPQSMIDFYAGDPED